MKTLSFFKKTLPYVRKKFLSIFLCLILIFFLLQLYTSIFILRLILALFLSLFISNMLTSFHAKEILRKNKLFLSQFITMYNNELRSNPDPYSSLHKTVIFFSKLKWREKNILLFLEKCKASFLLNLPLSHILEEWREIPLCPELKNIAILLREQCTSEGNLYILLKQLSRVLHDQCKLENWVRDDNYKQRLEAYVLLSFPILLGFFIHFTYPDFFSQAYQSILGNIFLLLSLMLSLLAFFLTLNLLQPKVKKRKYNHPPIHKTSYRLNKFLNQLPFLFKMATYIRMNYRRFERLIEIQLIKYAFTSLQQILPASLAYQEEKTIFLFQNLPFCVHKVLKACLPSFLLVFFLCSFFALYLGKPLLLLLFLLYIYIKLKEMVSFKVSYLQDLEKDFALYLSFLCALLQSAYVPRLALEKALLVLPKQNLFFELKHCLLTSQQGASLEENLECFSSFLPPSEMQASLKILVQYLESGSKDLLQLLHLQLDSHWSAARQKFKESSERKNLLLILPMLLNLLAITSMIMAPVMSQFLTFSL